MKVPFIDLFFFKISERISLLLKKFIFRLQSWRPSHALLWLKRQLTSYDTYSSQFEEDAYWRSAFSGQRILQISNAQYIQARSQGTTLPPLVMSYVPALLPIYRESSKHVLRNDYLSPQTFCKWHRMVFPRNVCTIIVEFPSPDCYARPTQQWHKPQNFAGTTHQATAE